MQYVVFVVDIAAGSTVNVGPFRNYPAAERMKGRLQRALRRTGDLWELIDDVATEGGFDVGIEPLVSATDWRSAVPDA